MVEPAGLIHRVRMNECEDRATASHPFVVKGPVDVVCHSLFAPIRDCSRGEGPRAYCGPGLANSSRAIAADNRRDGLVVSGSDLAGLNRGNRSTASQFDRLAHLEP